MRVLLLTWRPRKAKSTIQVDSVALAKLDDKPHTYEIGHSVSQAVTSDHAQQRQIESVWCMRLISLTF